MGLGALGAFLGSIVGGALVFGFYLLLHFKMPWAGTSIGLLAGYGARTLGRGTDNTLGFVAAAIALATALCTFFLMYGDDFMDRIVTIAISIVFCVGFAYRLGSE